MHKGHAVILVLFMAFSAIFAQDGQQDSSAQNFKKNFVPSSDYIAPAFPNLPKPLSLLSDTLLVPLGWIKADFGERDIEIHIDRDWTHITFTEYIDDEIFRVPFTAPVEWYFEHKMR